MRTTALSLTAACLAACLIPGAPGQAPANGPEVKKLHILMVFDTNDQVLAPGLAKDERALTRLWKTAIPKDRYTLTVLKGKQVTPEAVLGQVRKLKLGPDDGVLFFYGGHGAKDKKRGHYLPLKGGRYIVRADLRKALEATGAGLVALITDCCSTPLAIGRGGVDLEAKERGAEPKEVAATVSALLFRTRGTVDVTGATDNEAWGDDERGGLFTRATVQLLNRPLRELDRNKDGVLTWEEFFPQLRRQTEVQFDDWLKYMRSLNARDVPPRSKMQRPHAFVLGRRPAGAEKTYAVLLIENASDAELKYTCRWPGQANWLAVTLKPGEKRAHFVALSNAAAPLPEMEARFEGIREAKRLKARKWSGPSDPTKDNASASHYRLRANDKASDE